MTTRTRTRSTFQPPTEGQVSVFYTLTRGEGTTAPDEKQKSANREHAEFINAESTVAVVSGYSRGSYKIYVRTPLAVTDLFEADAEALTDESPFYATLRENGVWYCIVEDAGRNKTEARKRAEAFLASLQDVSNPLAVSLDGKYAPALTIALSQVNEEREYRRDEKRRTALAGLAREAGLDVNLLALAVKEDRLVWSTPPVAPRQVMVVVREDATSNLTERLVDEVVLAAGTVEGLGRIVHEGSVGEFLLAKRAREQAHQVATIIEARVKVRESILAVQNRTQRLLADLDKGEVIGRGFHDTLRLAEETEKAQQAATQYAAAVAAADLPAGFVQRLTTDEFTDAEDRHSRWTSETTRTALGALTALTGNAYNTANRYGW